jgi:hypothetical protein
MAADPCLWERPPGELVSTVVWRRRKNLLLRSAWLLPNGILIRGGNAPRQYDTSSRALTGRPLFPRHSWRAPCLNCMHIVKVAPYLNRFLTFFMRAFCSHVHLEMCDESGWRVKDKENETKISIWTAQKMIHLHNVPAQNIMVTKHARTKMSQMLKGLAINITRAWRLSSRYVLQRKT